VHGLPYIPVLLFSKNSIQALFTLKKAVQKCLALSSLIPAILKAILLSVLPHLTLRVWSSLTWWD